MLKKAVRRRLRGAGLLDKETNIMKTYQARTAATAALAAALSLTTLGAAASSIDCDTQGATANGSFADLCKASTSLTSNSGTSQNTYVDGQFESGFNYIGKWDWDKQDFESGNLAGFELTAQPSENGTYAFNYTLSVPELFLNRQVDWVLGVKQSTSFFAYLFEDVTLGIDGGFNSFSFQAGQGPNAGELVEGEKFSHVSGFIREQSVASVPEPSILALLGLGLVGVGVSSMRRRFSL